MRRLRGVAVLDPELGEALKAREGRQEQGLRVLVGRLPPRGMAVGSADDLIAVLRGLTSFETFDRLAQDRPVAEVEKLLRRSARALIGAGA
jgi:hypothetical protein